MAWLEEPVSPTHERRIAGTEIENSDSGEEDETWTKPNIIKECETDKGGSGRPYGDSPPIQELVPHMRKREE